MVLSFIWIIYSIFFFQHYFLVKFLGIFSGKTFLLWYHVVLPAHCYHDRLMIVTGDALFDALRIGAFVHIMKGHRSTLGAVPWEPFNLLFETDSLTGLELTK